MIPKNPPPTLDGNFSRPFKEFVSFCLQRDPRDVRVEQHDHEFQLIMTSKRPSARELLKHKFLRMAKKTNYLTELIERHERWRAEGGEKHEENGPDPEVDL